LHNVPPPEIINHCKGKKNFSIVLLSKKSLLEHTHNRIARLIPSKNISVVTTQQQSELIAKLFNTSIIEPYSRNTAPALLLCCLTLAAKDPNAVVVFFPADHYIKDEDKFEIAVKKAIEHSLQFDAITLLGVKPSYPATGYGYIEYYQEEDLAKVLRFYEKPSYEKAQHFFQSKTMLWNIGIFCAKMSVFIQEFKKLAPKTFEAVHDYFSTGNVDAYYNLESISVDYAIMEKSDALLVIPADFEWSDVGNLDTFLTLNEPTKNQEKQISIESQNNLVMAGNKLTVLIGVEDLCIVQTDDVLLIAKRGDVEKVKLAVNELRKNNLENYL
jgi:mannose-1-phosphate guanylyltransferase